MRRLEDQGRRRPALGCAAWCLVFTACVADLADVESTRGALIEDAAHGGRAGFYFLPPLVPRTPLPPTFDPTLTLVARLDGPSGPIASFPLEVRPNDRYRGRLDTRRLDLSPETAYRVRVSSGELQLGFADVQVFPNQRLAKSMASDAYFELVDGKDLVIEIYVNRCAIVTCDDLDACTTDTCIGTSGTCQSTPIPECAPPTGSLAVSAHVDEVPADGADLSVDGQVTLSEATIHAEAPPELDAWWPAGGTSEMAVVIAGHVGVWALRSTLRVCAPLDLDRAEGSGGASFAELVEESRGPAAEVCVSSIDGEHVLETRLVREGPATTPTLAALGRPRYRFEARFGLRLPGPVFDGATLDLRLLDGTHGPLPLHGALHVAEGAGAAPWYDADISGSATFVFRPTAD